jgi:large-conductance mechanosensitive channel
MRVSDILERAIGQSIGRVVWRAIAAAVAALAALITLYHLTVAGMIALQTEYGAVASRLIVAAIYAFVTFVVVIALWATRKKSKPDRVDAAALLSSSPQGRIAMLIEAALIGFAAGKKTPKSAP